MKAGFLRHGAEYGNPEESSDRFTFVATDGCSFVGCCSALAYRKAVGYCDWLYITDLFVLESYRNAGLGSSLLRALEQKAVEAGIGNIWTWTAGYEAPGFYIKHGYSVFIEMPNWYTSGHARIGLKKSLATSA